MAIKEPKNGELFSRRDLQMMKQELTDEYKYIFMPMKRAVWAAGMKLLIRMALMYWDIRDERDRLLELIEEKADADN